MLELTPVFFGVLHASKTKIIETNAQNSPKMTNKFLL